MKFQVFGEDELAKHLRAGGDHYSHCISINNSGTVMIPEIKQYYSSTNVMRIEFHDTELSDLPGVVAPEIKDVAKIINFFHDALPFASGFTIHCYAGVSRSTAIALCLLYLTHNDEKVAVLELMKIRPEAMPNRKIVEFFDSLMNSNLQAVIGEIYKMRIQRMREELMKYTENYNLNHAEELEEEEPVELCSYLDENPFGLLEKATMLRSL